MGEDHGKREPDGEGVNDGVVAVTGEDRTANHPDAARHDHPGIPCQHAGGHEPGGAGQADGAQGDVVVGGVDGNNDKGEAEQRVAQCGGEQGHH